MRVFFICFFVCSNFLNWKLSNLTIGTFLKSVETANYKGNVFLVQLHMARAMVKDCPLMHANPDPASMARWVLVEHVPMVGWFGPNFGSWQLL